MDDNIENMNKLNYFKNCNNTVDENIIKIIKEYDSKYVKEINKLSSLIANFISNTKSYIMTLSKACTTLKNQIHFSQFLIKEMDESSEKYSQVNDRVEMINNTSKLFDNHLLMANNKLNIFISEAKNEFKEIKNLRIEKINKIKMIQKVNCDKIFDKSSSRGKVKNNLLEYHDNYSNYETYSPHKYENVYNNFINSSNIQKNNFFDKQSTYNKININYFN